MVAGTSSLVLFAQFFDFLSITFLIPLLLLLMSFNLHILPEETNQLPISLSPSLLPYSWVTAPKLLNFAAHTSLRHLKPKLIAPLPPMFSLPIQGTGIHPGTQLRNVNLLWHHSPAHSAVASPSGPHCFWLGHFSCPQTVHPLFYISLLVLFKSKIFKCLQDKVQSPYFGI